MIFIASSDIFFWISKKNNFGGEMNTDILHVNVQLYPLDNKRYFLSVSKAIIIIVY